MLTAVHRYRLGVSAPAYAVFRLKTHALSARAANEQLQASMPRLNDAMALFSVLHKAHANTEAALGAEVCHCSSCLLRCDVADWCLLRCGMRD